MKKIKSIICMITVLALLIPFTACGDTSYAMNVGDETISSGLYLMFLMDAKSAAQNALAEQDDYDEEANIYDLTLEEKPVEDWIKDKCLQTCKEYVAVSDMFDELGLSLTEDAQTEYESYLNQWSDVSEYYSKNGIGRSSYETFLTYLYERQMIFDSMYKEGGTDEVSEDEIKAELEEMYVSVKVLYSATVDEAGAALPDDEIANGVELLEECADRINDGETYDDVKEHFNKETGVEPETTEEDGTTVLGNDVIILAWEDIDSTDYPTGLIKTSFDLDIDEATVLESNGGNYMIQRTDDLTTDDTYYDAYSANALNSLKIDEFDAIIAEAAEEYEVTLNESAINYYSPKKISDE